MTDEPLEPSTAETVASPDLSAEAIGEEAAQADPQSLKPILEALIFASPEPLTLKEMAQLLAGEAAKAEVEQALTLLRHDYERPDGGHSGLQLVEVAGG